MTKTVAIVIVNWNSWDLLARCLQALAAQTYTDFSVTVIDNASESNMPELLQIEHPSVRFVRNAKNIGFAAANNLAVAQHTGDSTWVVLLNPDAFAQPDWLARLQLAAQANPECAVFASRQLNAANPVLLDGDGDRYFVSGRAARVGFGQPVEEKNTADLTCHPVFSPCGAAAMYRRSVYLKLGGFDEDFFCYFEDVDLGFRLQLAGYSCLLIPQAVVLHVGSASTGGQHGDFAIYHGHRNMLWTFVKDMPGVLLVLLAPLHLALNLVAIAYFCLKGHGRVILRSKRDALLGLPQMWRKRDKVQASRVLTAASVFGILTKRL